MKHVISNFIRCTKILFLVLISSTSVFASPDENILGVDDSDLRTGTVDMNTIPEVLINVMNVMLGIAGTISIVALIYYSVQMQINSGITGDSSGVDNAKKGMKGAIFGFVLAILAWFIIVRLIEVLSSVF